MSTPGHGLAGRVMAILLVLFATTYAGCGGSDSAEDSTRTVTSAKTATSAGTRGKTQSARSAHGAAKSGSGSTHSSTHDATPSPGRRPLRRFTGDGNARLGTIVVRSPSLLVWSARQPAIQIFTSNGFMLVNSKAPNGFIRLAGGTYRGVRVASPASWSIELRSLSS